VAPEPSWLALPADTTLVPLEPVVTMAVSPRRILLVDPDGLLRWSVQTYFARWFDVVAVGTIADATSALDVGAAEILVASEDLEAEQIARLESQARRLNARVQLVRIGTRLADRRSRYSNPRYLEKPNILPQLAEVLGVEARLRGSGKRGAAMFIDDYMTTDVVTIRADAPLNQARSQLAKHGFHHLPVLDESDRLVGIITDRDVRSAYGVQNAISESLTVAEVMTADPMTISPAATLDEALAVFCTNRFGALPVVQHKKLVGMITTFDMLRAFYDVLGLDQPGCRVEVALPNVRADLAHAFEALKTAPGNLISAIVSRMRRDGGEPALYLRVAGEDPRAVERHLRDRALIVLEPERK